jgi:hypothetical protein
MRFTAQAGRCSCMPHLNRAAIDSRRFKNSNHSSFPHLGSFCLLGNLSVETMEALTRYQWPGNVRELENVVERAVMLSNGPALRMPVHALRSRIPCGRRHRSHALMVGAAGRVHRQNRRHRLLHGRRVRFAACTRTWVLSVQCELCGQLPRTAEAFFSGACPIVASYGAKDPWNRGVADHLQGVLTAAGVAHDVKE